MATNIFNFDGTLLTTVADGALDQTHASIKFPGRGYQNYGEPVMENLLWIMQNFAGTSAPQNPAIGQLWYDSTFGSSLLKIWTGAAWISAGGVIAAEIAPPSGSNQGAMWYDTKNKQLHSWNGDAWDLVGPLGSKINADPRDPSIPLNSTVEAMTVLATEDNLSRQVWRISIGGTILAVLSKDPTFTPQSTILTSNGFTSIRPGINFNSTITGVGLSGDKTVFKSTQTNLPDVDVAYDLGSAARQFNNIFAASGKFSGGLGVNVTPSAYAFEVNGTSKFANTLTVSTGTVNNAPLKFPASSYLTSTPQIGAIEFDGNNFYFTGLLNGQATRQQPVFNSNTINSKSLYVSSEGNDGNDGRSRTSPYRTINKALNYLKITNPPRSGYTIFVEGGEYLEQNPMYVPPRTSIVGDNLRRVIVRPVHNQLDLFHVDVGTFFFGMTFKDHRAPAFTFAFPCSTATAVVEDDTVSGYTGKITELKPTYSQSGYNIANPPEVFIEAPGFNQGTRASFRANIVNGAITDIIVTAGGSGFSFTNPPVVQITGSTVAGIVTGTGATAVARVSDDLTGPLVGKVLAIDITDPGQGYVAPITVAISGGGGTGASAIASIGDGVIRNYTQISPGSGYTRAPWVSIKGVIPPIITSSPYVQNCSSITGPFDKAVPDSSTLKGGRLIKDLTLPYPADGITYAGPGYGPVDPTGAGGGIRIDGEVVNNEPNGTVIRSFVADSFTQLNQGGIGHLIINRGYAQFVSCFTTFSSIGYWARSGGFANISNSVIDFGDVGLQAEGYYPVAYAEGTITATASSSVLAVTLTGSGATDGIKYTSDFDITIGAPTLPGGTQAAGRAKVVNGQVNSVQITNPGSGYASPPTVTFPIEPGMTVPATGYALLQYPTNIPLRKIDTPKPQFASGLKLGNVFYKVISITEDATNWLVVAVDQDGKKIPYYNIGAIAYFHDISNLSSGGLALEYVGSGVTYNALPRYGGVPNDTKQVVDGKTNGKSALIPGRVYYVTISNDGNFKIGEYFAVNFIDGSVTISADNFNLANIRQIGPFSAGGTYATEISLDPTLTHIGRPADDDHTLPTQSAVRGFFGQVSSSILPNASNVYTLGSSSYRWDDVRTAKVNADVANLTIVNSTTVNTAVASIATGIITTATVTNLTAREMTITGNLTATGNTIIFNTNAYAVSDSIIDIGTAINNQLLPSDDGKDRGVMMHYYNTAAIRGELAGDNHAFLGMRRSTGELIFVTNVQPGTTTMTNPVSLTGAVWGNVQVGSVTVNGDINATGDITGFYLSDERLKTNLQPIDDALTKVSMLNGVTFDWNATARESKPNRTRREAGIIAQQVEKVLPEVIETRLDGYKAVDYEKLVPLLIEAIKELSDKVDRLENRK
jgi:hypothetical protein